MKHLYTLALFSVLLFSCNSDDNDPEIACLTEPIFSNLFIDVVNAQGENLIANQTYIADNITIDDVTNGYTSSGVVFMGVPGIENLIALGIYGQDGDNTFEINLSDIETDTLVLNLTRSETGGPCSQFVFTLNSAVYNDEPKDIQDFGGDFLITVVKE
ncbi:hypothetical protein [Dokdonia sp.]|uniref:hypothetical protein n=1 Tax=Dokdonia sp. TaxID=2024995 RepID=UPI003267D099